MMPTSIHAASTALVFLVTAAAAASGDTCTDAIPVAIGDTPFDTSGYSDSAMPVEGHAATSGSRSSRPPTAP
jgi:hypothetical protein